MNSGTQFGKLQKAVFVGMFSPLVRVLPRVCARSAGRAAWLAPLIAAPAAALYLALCCLLLRCDSGGEGLAESIKHTFGAVFGRLILAAFFAFQVFYAGYILRNSAERLISTTYPDSSVWMFAVPLAAVCAAAASGRLAVLTRSAEVFHMILIGTLLVITVFSLGGVKSENLLPVSVADAPGVLEASAFTADMMSIAAYSLFLAGETEPGRRDALSAALRQLFTGALACALIVITAGSLGAAVTARAQQPFFIAVRDMSILNVFERIEAAVMALWIIADFTLISLVLMISAELLRALLGLRGRRLLALPCSAGALTAALLAAPNAFELWGVTVSVIPKVNAALTFLLLPGVLLSRAAALRIKKAKKSKKGY